MVDPAPPQTAGRGRCRVPDSLHAGDVLADRYRLDELLTESAGGRFWRAHDQVLDRPVAVHVIAAADERAEACSTLRGVRRRTTTAGCCACSTPTGPTRSATSSTSGARGPRSTSCWPVRAAGAATRGVDRLRGGREPGAGARRRAGPRADGPRERADRPQGAGPDHRLRRRRRTARAAAGRTLGRPSSNLGGLLYAALTGKWAGASTPRCPPRPTEHGRCCAAPGARRHPAAARRAVRPGHQPDSGHTPAPAHDRRPAGIAAALGRVRRRPDRDGQAAPTRLSGPRRPTRSPRQPRARPRRPSQAHRSPPSAATRARADPTPTRDPDDAGSRPGRRAPTPVELPTQAGIPVFDDNDEVGWLPTRSDRPHRLRRSRQPPKPLFAPEPPDGEPVRRRDPPPRRPAARRTGRGSRPVRQHRQHRHRHRRGTATRTGERRRARPTRSGWRW